MSRDDVDIEIETSGETTPLLINTSPRDGDALVVKKAAETQSTVWRLVIIGTGSALIAVHLIGNSIILSQLGPDDEAASSLVSTIQSFVSGSCFGLLLSTGYQLGITLGKNDAGAFSAEAFKNEIAGIIKTSWVVGAGLGVISAGILSSMPSVMPLIVTPSTGKVVGDYFRVFAAGAFAEFMGGNNGIIIAQFEKNVVLSFVSTAVLYRIPALGLAYFFANQLEFGAYGVALGAVVAAIGSFSISQLLFLRKHYKDLHLFSCSIKDFKKRLISYLGDGWKLSLQRITEWGNLLAITTIIGARSNFELQALSPGMQANTLIGLGSQGVAQGVMMFFGQDCKRKQQHLVEFKKNLDRSELAKFLEFQSINKRTFIKNNLSGMALATLLSTGIYLARKPIIDVFLGSDAPDDQFSLSESMLLYMLISSIPDSLRIVSSGILRGWGDLLYPTLWSLILMTVIGVPAGEGFSYLNEEGVLTFIWARIATVFLSALINIHRFNGHMKNDKASYTQCIDMLDILDALSTQDESYRQENLRTNPNFPLLLQETGFQLVADPTNINDLFSTIRDKGYGESIDEIKKLISNELANQMPKLSEKFQSREAVLESLSSRNEDSHRLIISALSKSLKLNITVINSDRSIIREKGGDENSSILYIAYDTEQRKYFNLEGGPNRTFPELVEEKTIPSISMTENSIFSLFSRKNKRSSELSSVLETTNALAYSASE